MALAFVLFEHLLNTFVQPLIYCPQSFADVFMYSRLAYIKLFGCLTHGGVIFDDILGEQDRSLFGQPFQNQPSLRCTVLMYMRSNCKDMTSKEGDENL